MMDVTLLSKSPDHIDTMVKFFYNKTLHFTRFYGNLKANLKELSWTFPKRLNQRSTSWFVCRDFNEIKYSTKKIGKGFHSIRQMVAFREVLNVCELWAYLF